MCNSCAKARNPIQLFAMFKMLNKMLMSTLMTALICLCAITEARPDYDKSPSDSLQAAAFDFNLSHISEAIELNDNYNVIMPDYYDHHQDESVQYQDFKQFIESDMFGSNDLGMDETQLLQKQSLIQREPQPLTAEERRIRAILSTVDIKHEKRSLQKLKKGSTVPKGDNAKQWEQFDYDLYSFYPDGSKKSIYG